MYAHYRLGLKSRSQDKPVALVLNSQVNGLGVIRSLGMKEVPVLALDPDPFAVGMHSRYVKEKAVCPDPLHNEEAFVNLLISIGKEMNVPGILFPTTDAYVVAVVNSSNCLI
jgi:predicted ATP-grasp superfamily ATP-dependent carboligase